MVLNGLVGGKLALVGVVLMTGVLKGVALDDLELSSKGAPQANRPRMTNAMHAPDLIFVANISLSLPRG
jgi:hypothetical protein